MTDSLDDGIKAFYDAVVAKDIQRAGAVLAEDIVFRPPTYWKDWQGREIVTLILSQVVEVLEDFRYTRIFQNAPDYALEFKARIGDLDVEGVDLIKLNQDNKVQELTVVMRPLKSIQALREAMQDRLKLG